MVGIVTHVYGLNTIVATEHGKLIKNENVYNLIMSYLFKKTRLKHFIVNCIKKNEESTGTDYLFLGMKSSNLESTIKKLDAMNSFGESFVPRL
jgi:hypothetical protein